MKTLVILCLLLIQQIALSRPSALTLQTRHLIKSGHIFGNDHVVSGKWFSNPKIMAALKEINSHHYLTNTAKKLVKTEHGDALLSDFEWMLDMQMLLNLFFSLANDVVSASNSGDVSELEAEPAHTKSKKLKEVTDRLTAHPYWKEWERKQNISG